MGGVVVGGGALPGDELVARAYDTSAQHALNARGRSRVGVVNNNNDALSSTPQSSIALQLQRNVAPAAPAPPTPAIALTAAAVAAVGGGVGGGGVGGGATTPPVAMSELLRVSKMS